MIDAEEIRDLAVNALDDLKAVNLAVLDVRGKSSVTDFMVIASGTSDRHLKAMADNVIVEAKKAGIKPLGVEGDAKILQIAQAKSESANVKIEFDQGLATQLPYADSSYDRVFSTLFFHHLGNSDKTRAFAEIFRVLKPGGQLHVADWGKPTNALMRLLFYSIRVLDGFANTKDNVEGQLPNLIQRAGFNDVRIDDQFSTVFGTLTLYRASKDQCERY